jgi:hypothetical protein
MSDSLTAFYSTIAGVSAVLFALMFTAVQVREDCWRGNALRTTSAVVSVVELLLVLVAGLVALMPGHRVYLAATIAGVFGLVSLLPRYLTYSASWSWATGYDTVQAWFSGLSVVVYGGLLVASLPSVWEAAPSSPEVPLGVTLGLLTWLLVSGSAEVVGLLMFSDRPATGR